VPVTRLAPVDQRLQGRSSWVPLMLGEPRTTRAESPPLPRGRDPGGFERACASGRPVVTVEVGPPDSADPGPLIARARVFEGLVDAINITDGAGGNCHMSSAAAAAVLVAHGMTPVCQVTCRDRNRIAIQGDLLGAAALGVRNLLCLTGDDVGRGDQPQARAVFDLDVVSLLDVARGMRDAGVFASGRRLEVPPDLFLGATANPFAPPFGDRVVNLAKKVDAGAAFVQTQFCFDVAMLERFMREVRARGLHARAAILVGVGTLASPRALRWMGAHVPGVHVPEWLLRRLEDAADPVAEAVRACVETIDAVMSIDGVRGVHLMGHRNETMLAEIIAASGLRSARLARAA
jgi:5,10-methylenetetrahydrofolate reductase